MTPVSWWFSLVVPEKTLFLVFIRTNIISVTGYLLLTQPFACLGALNNGETYKNRLSEKSHHIIPITMWSLIYTEYLVMITRCLYKYVQHRWVGMGTNGCHDNLLRQVTWFVFTKTNCNLQIYTSYINHGLIFNCGLKCRNIYRK